LSQNSLLRTHIYVYPKKFGLTRRRITPDAPRIANPIATFIIKSLPHFASPVDHITPPATIITKEAIRITLINILTNAVTRIGNAVVSLIVEVGSCAVVAIQFPINGIVVFNFTPQQTPGVEQSSQVVVQSG